MRPYLNTATRFNGVNPASFDRGINGRSINNVINSYNANFAGKPTPAGQVLINQFGFTQSELTRASRALVRMRVSRVKT